MGITINLDKAKDVTKDQLRVKRDPLFKVLDIELQRALETGSDTSSIVAEKQRLRDITKLADQATSLDDLKSLLSKI
jgi:hypothetical protein